MKLLPFGNYSVGHIITYEKSLVYSNFSIVLIARVFERRAAGLFFCYHGAIQVDDAK